MRTIVNFPCGTDNMTGAFDAADGTTGLLIISGGNEIRSGAYAGQAAMAQHFQALVAQVLAERAVQCGGIKASLDGGDLGEAGYSFIDSWVDIVRPARDKVLASASQDPQRDLELEAIRVSLANLRSFPFIAEREQSGQLKLHGAYFGISDGNLYVLNDENDSFEVQ